VKVAGGLRDGWRFFSNVRQHRPVFRLGGRKVNGKFCDDERAAFCFICHG
jgi:hypothetical protein